MHFYDKFLLLCDRKKVDAVTAYKEMNINKGTVSIWKKNALAGNPVVPSTKIAKKMSDYFGEPPEFFLYEDATLEPKENKKTADQKADGLRGTGYDLLTPENKGMIDALIESLLKSQSGE